MSEQAPRTSATSTKERRLRLPLPSKNTLKRVAKVGTIGVTGAAAVGAAVSLPSFLGYTHAKGKRENLLQGYDAKKKAQVQRDLGKTVSALNFVYVFHSGVNVRETTASVNSVRMLGLFFRHTHTPDNISFTVPKGEDLIVRDPLQHSDNGSLWPQFRMAKDVDQVIGPKDNVAQTVADSLLTINLSALSVSDKDKYERLSYPNAGNDAMSPYPTSVTATMTSDGRIEIGKDPVATATLVPAGQADQWFKTFTTPGQK